MVYIHGGGYMNGAPQNASSIVDFAGDIIYVMVNYRLNIFGFLGSSELRSRDGELGSTGYYGIQDQRLAMKWTRENIHFFGGDGSKITIDGCSAGAGSTTQHIINKRSWPYFDYAAGESGVTSGWNTNTMDQAQLMYEYVLEASQCPAGSLNCLLSKTTQELHEIAQNASKLDNGFFGSCGLAFAPVIDGVELVDTPRSLVARGEIFDGPILMDIFGANATELLDLYSNESKVCATEGGTLANEFWWSYILQSSDFSFHCPHKEAAKLFYKFKRKVILDDTPDGDLWKMMTLYWTSFIKNGNPNTEKHPDSPTWPSYDGLDKNLAFDIPERGGIRVESGYRFAECNYWASLGDHSCF
eukprot:UC4_evm1s590